MIVTIIGARPQFVKAAVVSKALQDERIEEKIIHTGQHYDERMSNIFWEELGIPPYDVNLGVGSQRHGAQTAEMIQKIELYFVDHQDKIKGILLYGDTNSTLAGSIVASKMKPFKVIHIEAGLRSFNRHMPEEINRIVTDHLSDILFCSSDSSVQQLRKESVIGEIYEVGDVMYDAVKTFGPIADRSVNLADLLPFDADAFLLATIHRPANTDNPENLSNIIDTLGALDLPCLWPVHPRN
ncbi:MAG: UDP-N-acetylglucosamine 2-epimerase, partial [Saprospiraceae bacterium]|nr:UDP-N-acetylglucosamine 2-epimerase [Saprospiraceae bacterium]